MIGDGYHPKQSGAAAPGAAREPLAGGAALADPASDHPLPDEPYRGINSFRFIDAPIFFGRDEDIQRLLRCVSVYRGTLLYGESGVGKTSLVNAGFIPEALRHGFIPERLRVQPQPGQEIVVERISLNADNRAPYLPSNLLPESSEVDKATLSVAHFVERVSGIPAERRPLLIFDQFEELVTLFEEAPNDDQAAEALRMQEALLDAIVVLLTRHTAPVKLLFSFREDYLAKFTKLFRRAPDLPDQFLRLTAPRIADLEAMIRGPIERFPERFGGRFAPELPRELAQAFAARVGAGQLSLTEVQIACLELWRAPDASAALRAPDGLRGILEQYFARVIEQFSAEERRAVGALLSRMVTRSGARNIVSRDDLLTTPTPLPPERLESLLAQLDTEQRRLVRKELRQDVPYYTIVSEFLVPWIRRWREERLREEALAEEQRLQQEALRQKEEERQELERRIELERKEARAQRMRMILGSIAVVAIALAAFVVVLMRQNGELRARESETRRLNLAIADTNTTLRHVRDSVNLIAQRRADSIADMTRGRLAELSRADSLSSSNRSVQEQLASERAARQRLQVAYERQEKLLAAQQSAQNSANENYQSTSAATQRELNELRAVSKRYLDLLDAMRGQKDPALRNYAEQACRNEPLCRRAATKY
jgi:hypothetical protein